MTTTIEQDIQTNLAAIFAAVPGIRTAYTAAPMAIQTINLPAVISFAGQAAPTGKQSPKWMEVARDYSIRIYIAAIQAGETGDAETDVIPWIAAGTQAILKHPSLGTGTKSSQVPWVMTMEYAGDSGLAMLPAFNGEQFLGVEFKIRVTYKIPYTFGTNE